MSGGVRHRRVAPRDPTCGDNSRRPSRRCGTPKVTAHPDDAAPAVVRDHRLEDSVAAPSIGEGRNTVLRRGRYASQASEPVHNRDGSSGRIGEQNGTNKSRYECHHYTVASAPDGFCADDGEIVLCYAALGRRRDRSRLFGVRGRRGTWCSMAARRMRFSRV